MWKGTNHHQTLSSHRYPLHLDACLDVLVCSLLVVSTHLPIFYLKSLWPTITLLPSSFPELLQQDIWHKYNQLLVISASDYRQPMTYPSEAISSSWNHSCDHRWSPNGVQVSLSMLMVQWDWVVPKVIQLFHHPPLQHQVWRWRHT